MSTSSPVFSAIFSYRMREPVFLSSWWKWTLWSRTAEYTLTGTLTSPKLTEPDQIALAMALIYPAGDGPRHRVRVRSCHPG